MNYQNSCQEMLDQFETKLRAFISKQLNEKYGNNWWKTNVPGGVIANCEERRRNDLTRKLPKVPIGNPIDYTHIGELKDIIVRKDNYENVFNNFFGTNPNGIRAKLDEIGLMRDPVRHVRPGVGEREYNRLKVSCDDILDAVGASMKQIQGPRSIDKDSEETEDIEIQEIIKPVSCSNNLPRPDYSQFFGREKERQTVLDHLAHPRAWVVSIDGIGGVGKTSLALNCAYALQEQSLKLEKPFEYIIWASAKTQRLSTRGVIPLNQTFSDLDTFLSVVLEVTGFGDKSDAPCSEKKKLVEEILSLTTCLLVLDNLESIRDLEMFAFLSNIPSPSKALVTTRVRIEESQRNVRLTALPMDEARALVNELANELDATEIANAPSAELDRLIQRVGGIPLAIKLAVGRIAAGTSLHLYIGRLESGGAQEDILEFCFSDTWSGLTADEKRIVQIAALFYVPASEEELRQVANLPELRVKEALANLLRHSFLNATRDITSETFHYSILPLTADFVLRRLREDSTLERDLQDNYRTYLAEKGRYEEALQQLGPLVKSEGPILERERLSNMLVEAAFRAYQNGQYSQAVARLESAQTYQETAFLYHTWGVIERDENRFGTARDKFRKAVQLDPQALATWRSWGKMEQRLRNLPQAIDCFSHAVELVGSDPQDHHGLGVCLSRLSREARSNEERRRHLSRSITSLRCGFYPNPVGYRETHHNVVNSHALALTLAFMGETRKALEQCENGLALEPSNEKLLILKSELGQTSLQ
jgi:tetratricopeptide (TPR) repeat protein